MIHDMIYHDIPCTFACPCSSQPGVFTVSFKVQDLSCLEQSYRLFLCQSLPRPSLSNFAMLEQNKDTCQHFLSTWHARPHAGTIGNKKWILHIAQICLWYPTIMLNMSNVAVRQQVLDALVCSPCGLSRIDSMALWAIAGMPQKGFGLLDATNCFAIFSATSYASHSKAARCLVSQKLHVGLLPLRERKSSQQSYIHQPKQRLVARVSLWDTWWKRPKSKKDSGPKEWVEAVLPLVSVLVGFAVSVFLSERV